MQAQKDAVFNIDPPEMTVPQVKSLLRDHYGIEADVTLLVGERDLNFKVTLKQQQYVLKISNAIEQRSHLDLQNAVLEHLQSTRLKDLVPAVIRSKQDEPIVHANGRQTKHWVRLLSFLSGDVYSKVAIDEELLSEMGNYLGSMTKALSSFGHPAAHREDFLWNLDNALACRELVNQIEDEKRSASFVEFFDYYESSVLPKLAGLRKAVIHNDANGYNIIVTPKTKKIAGLIDFGDVCFARQINELAVAMAYLLQGQPDLYKSSQLLIKAYVSQFPLLLEEIEVLFDLIKMRLVMSLCISSSRAKEGENNDYLLISQKPAVALLDRLANVNPEFITAVFKDAAGFAAIATARKIENWLRSKACQPVDLFDFNLARANKRVLPLDIPIENPRIEHFSQMLTDEDKANSVVCLLGRYAEDRIIYTAEQFSSPVTSEPRSRHLGLDVFIDANAPLYAPLPGRVYAIDNNAVAQGFGPTLILQHDTDDEQIKFFTLYGHLSTSVFDLLKPGQAVEAGQLIGHIGDYAVNGNWAPHLHFQLMTDMLDLTEGFHGVGEKSLWPIWSQVCLDPNLITGLVPEALEVSELGDASELLQHRQQVLGPSLSTAYRNKLHIVRGSGAYLYDQQGRAYLDCVNNISHVGHCHPQVTQALERQSKTLNTNTRYLHGTVIEYAKRIAQTLPDPLSVVYFVNSGTEANELALRIARTATGIKDTIVLDWAYHGNSSATVEISPYKFKRSGGFKQPEFVEIAEFPDPYRGQYKARSQDAAAAYAHSVAECVNRIQDRTGHGPAAFIAESISGVGGQVMYPDGYLQQAYQIVRRAGGVCIADEVQCGFGRVGSHFWAFELQNVVPDIVVLGKPIGNGHPLAAVVTTKALADKFANGMEYFNSFGGNPVSAAVGMAVMDVIEDEGLMQHAFNVGHYLLEKLNQLKVQYPVIGDVRGAGLFLGIELVEDHQTLTPAKDLAGSIINELRENGILMSTDGPWENVLKFKPPMVFSTHDADLLVQALAASLQKYSNSKS